MKKGLLALTILFGFSLTNAFAMPNPAAVNCGKQGYQYIMLKNTGFCVFPDGSYCEEWAYQRGQCDMGQYYIPGGKYKKRNMNRYCVYRKKGKTTIRWCPAY